MNAYEKLHKVQQGLKAPKGQFNAFGKYKYRSCEDILEAVKPLLEGAVITLSDKIEMVGDRYYVKATAAFVSTDNSDNGYESVIVHAYAREEADKKGMDSSQITGAASSYARKYALNGLLQIDDAKDSDATNTHDDAPKKYTVVKETSPKVDGMGNKVEDVPDPPVEDPNLKIGATHECYQTLMGYISQAQWDKNKIDAFVDFLNNYPTSVDGTDQPKRVLLTTQDLRDMKIGDARYLTEQRRWNSAITVFYNALRKRSKAA